MIRNVYLPSFIFGLKHLKKYKTKLAFAIFWSIIFVMMPMQIAIVTGALVDGLVAVNGVQQKHTLLYGFIDMGESPNQILAFGFVSLLIISLVFGISSYLRISLRSILGKNFAFDLQRDIIQKLEFLSIDLHNKYGSGELLNQVLVDTNNLRPFVEATIIKTITNIFRLSFPLVIFFLIDPYLGMIAISVLPFHFIIILFMQSKIRKILKKQRDDKAKLTMFLKDNLDGIESIQTASAEIHSINRLSKQIEKIEISQVRSQWYYGLMMGFAWGLTTLGIALVWWQGGLSVIAGKISIGQLVMFSAFALYAYTPVKRFTQDVKDIHRSLIALRHIRNILQVSSSIKEIEDPTQLVISEGRVQLKDVSLSYGEKGQHLKKISIDIEPNSVTAIVGRTGSGKSSIMRLIARLYDPSEGQVMIDGQNIRNSDIQSLRSKIAVVPQHPAIITGTIKENVKLANPDATDEEVKEACIIADAFGFINYFQKGLDTVIGQGGSYVSVEEIRKIAIARALLKKAKIILLDDPISSLDVESTASFLNTLNRLKSHKTIVLTLRNLDSFDKVDKVILIDDGVVVDIIERPMAKTLQVGSFLSYPGYDFDDQYILNTLYNNSMSNSELTPNSESSSNAESFSNPDEKDENPSQFQGIIDYNVIGRTPKKRRMEIVYLGKMTDPKLKILIMAGQHGDERYSRKATERLLTNLISTKVKEFPDLCIAILPNANPDGSYNNTRNNSNDINLNRDHLLLASAENRLVHSFVHSWKPDIVIDVHTFPPERDYLNEKGLMFYHDILLDGATNLGIRKKMDQKMLDNFIKGVQSALKPFDYSCARYVLIEPDGRIRNSTNDIEDARNFLSLRYDLLSILIEGKEPISKDKEEIERTISSMCQALLSILKWSDDNYKVVKNMKLPEYKKGDRLAIRYSTDEPTSLKMNFQDKATKEVKEIDFSTYASNMRETRSIRLPSAYAIPLEKNKVIRLLHRQGFISGRVKDTVPHKLERYMVLTFTPSKSSKPRPPTDVRIISIEDEDDLSNYEIFPIDQAGGHILPYLLEPQSEYGLLRYKELDLAISPGEHYSILRISEDKVNKLIRRDSEIAETTEISQ